MDNAVYEHRTIRNLHGLPQRRLYLAHLRHTQPDGPVGLRQLDEIRLDGDVNTGVAAVPEKLLPLANHSQVAVVHYQHLDRQLVLDGGC